jgi:glycolate oxidase iron-sulfur subunit
LKMAFSLARFFRNAGLARVLLKTGIAKLFSRKIEFGVALLESSAGKRRNVSQKQNSSVSAVDNPQTALLFTGCVGAGLFSRVNEATARVLEVNGFSVEAPSAQVCCGALHAHAGDLDGARTLARKNLKVFSNAGDAPIITNAGGCGAMLASYAHLLEHDDSVVDEARRFSGRVRDVSQQLETEQLKTGADLPSDTVTYDASCHLLYGQHAGEAPLKIVGAVKGLKFARLEGSERCCGGAGIYNLMEPEMSGQVLEEKLANIKDTGATILATGNPGCQMQIGAGARLAGMDLTVCHPIELLDESYRRAGFYDVKEPTAVAPDRRNDVCRSGSSD